MSDRFNDEAAKIDASRLSGNDYVAALLRAAVRMAKEDRDAETMEGARAVEHVEVMAGKPVAGEWARSGRHGNARVVHGHDGTRAFHDGAWAVFRMDCDKAIRPGTEERSADLQSAMAAADAWARANPHLLDWQMPPASVEVKARGYTDAEVERMARAGDLARFGERMASLADRRFVERLISEGVAKDNWDTAVLAEKAKIDAEKMPPASEPYWHRATSVPFTAACGCDDVDTQTTAIPDRVTCPACLAMPPASEPAPRETPLTIAPCASCASGFHDRCHARLDVGPLAPRPCACVPCGQQWERDALATDAPRETPAPSVSDHLLSALNLHRSKCGECSENVDGCETAQRIEAVMCEVNPSAYFTSEPIADDKEQP